MIMIVYECNKAENGILYISGSSAWVKAAMGRPPVILAIFLAELFQ